MKEGIKKNKMMCKFLMFNKVTMELIKLFRGGTLPLEAVSRTTLSIHSHN